MAGLGYQIRNDEEIKALRKEWNEKITDRMFPLFHFETYRGIEDYKQRVRAELDSLIKEQEEKEYKKL